LKRLQLLSRLETHSLARRNRNLCASPWVAADSCLARAHVKYTESSKFDPFSPSESSLHALEDGFDCHFGFRLGYPRPIDHFIDNIELDQSRLRKPHDRIRVIVLSSAALPIELFRRACGLFATGVAVLTTRPLDGAPHGITINSFTSLSLDPPLVMVAIDRACSFLNTFESSGHYVVNILAETQRDLSVRFAELPEGRFTGVSWEPGTTGGPVIEGVLAVLECRTTQILDSGDHRVLVGEVVNVRFGEGRPLLFFNGDYNRLK
jgi:flavin reductase (DIM6/NTAB) family NADH-FMN oxidoreductase RutF